MEFLYVDLVACNLTKINSFVSSEDEEGFGGFVLFCFGISYRIFYMDVHMICKIILILILIIQF